MKTTYAAIGVLLVSLGCAKTPTRQPTAAAHANVVESANGSTTKATGKKKSRTSRFEGNPYRHGALPLPNLPAGSAVEVSAFVDWLEANRNHHVYAAKHQRGKYYRLAGFTIGASTASALVLALNEPIDSNNPGMSTNIAAIGTLATATLASFLTTFRHKEDAQMHQTCARVIEMSVRSKMFTWAADVEAFREERMKLVSSLNDLGCLLIQPTEFYTPQVGMTKDPSPSITPAATDPPLGATPVVTSTPDP